MLLQQVLHHTNYTDPKTAPIVALFNIEFYITQIIQDPKTYRYYIMTNYKLVRKDLILLSIKEES